MYSYLPLHLHIHQQQHIPVKLTWIFPGAPAPGNVQGNKPGMQAVHVQTFRVTTHHWIPLTKGKNCVNTHAKHVGDVIPGFESTTKYIFTKYGDEFQQLL